MPAQLSRGIHICSSLLQHGVASRLLQPAACASLASLPLVLQPFTCLRSFSTDSRNTSHLRDFAIIGRFKHLQLSELKASVLISTWYLSLLPDGLSDLVAAHVDHGKTTLMDRLLSRTGNTLAGDRVMDSNALEKERGITISSKYTSFVYKGHTINAVDTPGHADFGGEVERYVGNGLGNMTTSKAHAIMNVYKRCTHSKHASSTQTFGLVSNAEYWAWWTELCC